MKMKKMLAIVVAIGLMITCIGCGNTKEASDSGKESGTSEGGGDSSGAVEIEYWSLFTGADGETMTKMVSEFNKEYEGKIKVNLVTQDWDNYYTKIKTAILGGQAPDLCNSHDEYVNGLIKENIIVPIDEACETTGVKIEIGRAHV